MSDRHLVAHTRPSLDDVVKTVRGRFTLGPEAVASSDRIFYDTFDGLLRKAGITLELPAEDPPDQASVSQDVRDAIGVRKLLALARVRTTTETVALLDELHKTVVRIDVVSAWLVPPQGAERPLTTRLHLRELRGYGDQSALVEGLLVDALGLAEAELPLADEAVLAAGGIPGGVSSKIEVALRAGERSDTAAVRVLSRLLEVMDANLPGTIADIDPEFLHDYRVSIRRTRSVQRQLKQVFPPGELAHMRDEFRWLQLSTGDARDLDVYVLGFDSMRKLVPDPMGADLDPLLVVLRRRREAAHREMVRSLRSDRAVTIRAGWEALLAGLEDRPDADRPYASRPIGEVASERIVKVYRKMVKMGRAIGAASPPGEYHELRKKGKELRYLLELFGRPLHDPRVVKPMIKRLKDLQDVLGHHQDREVQIEMLRTVSDELSILPGGARALMVMGVLLERLEADAAASRADFAGRFEVFAGKEQRQLVRDTF